MKNNLILRVGRARLILLLLFLPIFISSALAIDLPVGIPILQLQNVSGGSGSGSSGIPSNILNLTYWKLDGTNAPPTADWNMGGFGFRGVGNTYFRMTEIFNFTIDSLIANSTTITSNANTLGRYLYSSGINNIFDSKVSGFGSQGESVIGTINVINGSGDIIAVSNPILVFGNNNKVGNQTLANNIVVVGNNVNDTYDDDANTQVRRRGTFIGRLNNLLHFNDTAVTFQGVPPTYYGNKFCMSNGTDCILPYNYTIPSVEVAQNYTVNYVASQGYRQTICFGRTATSADSFLGVGLAVSSQGAGFIPAHNGSVLAVTGVGTAGAVIAGSEINNTIYLNISRTTVFSNDGIFIGSAENRRYNNSTTRGMFNFTINDNITAFYDIRQGAGQFTINSYCVEYVYDY